jgi:DnaK suppressor protein
MLSDTQHHEILEDLYTLQAELLIFIADETGATQTVELDQSTQGRLSRIDAMQAQKMAEAQGRRAKQRLERVRSVLAIHADPGQDFGACRVCEDAISYRRLKAQPDALFCVQCAQDREG